MAILPDYSSLREAVQSWCARSDTKFRAQIPVFVAACEERIYNGQGVPGADPIYTPPLRAKELEAANVSVTITDGIGELPADIVDIRSVEVAEQPSGLTFLPPERFAAESALNAGGGAPLFYTIEGTAIALTPTWSGNATVSYWHRLTALTEDTPVNAILTAHPLIYLEGTLYEAFTFIREAELALGHLAKMRGLVQGANMAAAGRRFGGALRIRQRVPLA